MLLMTQEIRKRIPKLYAQEKLGGEAIVHVKFFTPDSSWTWYATEFDGENEFFGLVTDGGQFPELGYFYLSELETARGPLGLKIERDMYFKPKPLSALADCPDWLKNIQLEEMAA